MRRAFRSIPFYKELTAVRDNAGIHTPVVAVFPEPARDAKQFLDKGHVPLQVAAHANFKDLNVSLTPSVALVNNRGEVIDAWIGELTKSSQQEVLRAVAR